MRRRTTTKLKVGRDETKDLLMNKARKMNEKMDRIVAQLSDDTTHKDTEATAFLTTQ